MERAVVLEAMMALELVFQASSVGLIAQDARGVFIVPRPGMSVELFRALGTVDWQAEVRVAEEHSE
jgi:hypothetical protein